MYLYMCIRICVYACMYVYIYIYVHLSLSLYIYIYIYTHNTFIVAMIYSARPPSRGGRPGKVVVCVVGVVV